MTLRKTDKLDHISLDYRTLKKDSHFGTRVFLFYFFPLIHIHVIICQMLLSENHECTDLLKKYYASSSLSLYHQTVAFSFGDANSQCYHICKMFLSQLLSHTQKATTYSVLGLLKSLLVQFSFLNVLQQLLNDNHSDSQGFLLWLNELWLRLCVHFTSKYFKDPMNVEQYALRCGDIIIIQHGCSQRAYEIAKEMRCL